MKSWFQSKTIWANIILAALGIISEVSNIFPVSQYPKLWVSITAVLNILLRLITGTPIGTDAAKK